MLTRTSLSWPWKHNRWENFKLYTTHHEENKTSYSYIVSTNNRITKLAKSGNLDVARHMFDLMPARTVVSWNAMISGYSKWRKYNESLALLSLMHRSNTKTNETTISTTLSACAQSQSLHYGQQIHCLVSKSGLDTFKLVGSALLYFYASCLKIESAKQVFDELIDHNELLWSLMLVGYVQCGLMDEALNVFKKMPKRDVVSWTTLISGYAKSEYGCGKAMELFWWMRGSGEVVPNEFTLDSAVRVCGRLGDFQEGTVIHGILIKCGLELDYSIGGALIEFYCCCEAVDEAKKVYDSIVNPSLNASNMLISGLTSMGKIENAEMVFNTLAEKNTVSYNLMIKGYAICGRVEESKKLFEEMPQKTLVSSNTMISVYSRNSEIDKALKVFEEEKEERNPVTWNSMMSGYVQDDQHEEALRLYMTMRRLSIDCTRSTFSVLFHACSCLGSLQQGQLLHAHLAKTPFVSNVYVGTSLVDMYAKCGSLADAQSSFASISAPNVAAWTALINGHAHHGLGSEAVLLFQHMVEQKIDPNAATFVGVLSACRRLGMVNEGMEFFFSMENIYGVIPTLEHYACVVDLLGMSGLLLEAEEFIRQMPVKADAIIWGSLLSACRFWKNMEVGERVAEKMLCLDPNSTVAYVLMSNIYAGLGKWGEKMDMRKRLKELEVKKDPGCSWIELNCRLHVFSVEDRTHPYCDVIYATLKHLMANANSVVEFDFVCIPILTDKVSFHITCCC
ncbi:hypothetical protein HS088_TW18G01107 [Tripterygium wilfordii]|uniref:Pentatricopeptide repeat-containing protein n=2 Tax=Tripterygium wilfordii TaxID=458696 RepID=A0A7J7CE82_TRIWF|nr:hypothetical protein HS088_TW18G01107 [Tripterygium wilfordii]